METKPPITEATKGILPLEELTLLINGREHVLEKRDVLYLSIESKAREMVLWYLNKKRFPSMCSQVLRLLAMVAATKNK